MRRSKVREHIFKMLFSIGFDAADTDEQIELYLEQVEEASEEEVLAAKMMEANGNTVDYTA